MIKDIYKIFFLLLTVLMVSCVNDDPAGGSRVSVGDALPSFSVEMVDGCTVSSADYLGRGGLLLFFNTGCADCRMEFGAVQTAYDRTRTGDAATAPLFVCIAREETDPDIAAYWQLQHLTLPYSPQADRSIYSLFADRDIPRIYIVGRDGCIRNLYGPDSRPSADRLVSDLK